MWHVTQRDPDTRAVAVLSRHRTEAGAERAWRKRRRALLRGYGRFLAGLRIWTQAEFEEHGRAELLDLGRRLRGENDRAGAWIRAAREARGWTQAELAEALSRVLGRQVTVPEISRWENGGRVPRPSMMLVLRQVLEMVPARAGMSQL